MLWGFLTVFLTPQVMENIEKIQSKDAILRDYLSLGILPEFGEGAVAEHTEAYESSRSEYLNEIFMDEKYSLDKDFSETERIAIITKLWYTIKQLCK